MSMNTEMTEGGLANAPQQFQADRNFMPDRQTMRTGSSPEHDQSAHWDEMSLTMRQFYQSPVRTAG